MTACPRNSLASRAKPDDQRTEQGRRALGLVLLLLSVGCSSRDLQEAYGRRRGFGEGTSINGTTVWSEMFAAAGHRVFSWNRLSPRLHECQTLVWVPDHFGVPSEEERDYLEGWLQDEPGRTLIYVGRDFDAAPEYWRSILRLVPPDQQNEVERREALARAIHDKRRAQLPLSESCHWFRLESNLPARQITTLDGPWAAGVDPTSIHVPLGARLQLPSPADLRDWNEHLELEDTKANAQLTRLLYSADDPLITRISRPEWSGGQILIVANGSFLLNLPLVEPTHRLLAARLVAACGKPGRTAFLESGEEGLPVLEQEPDQAAPTGFEVFTVWPIGVILLHLTAMGILAAVALFPVFGRPRELPPVARADFGQHVAALGELLEATGDRRYAEERLRHYWETVKHSTSRETRKRT